tara:strand:- start:42 stop:755 length:714 start_codon:yes stop_codon:yes gene_type:complete
LGKNIEIGNHSKIMSTIALIPARGGSKGIPRKNIKQFCSKPLIYWSIKVALESEFIDRVIVSTEDDEIAKIAKSFSAEVPFIRPTELSNDKSPGIDPVIHALQKLPEVNDLLLLQPTSPIRQKKDIEGIFHKRSMHHSDSAVSVTESSKSLNLFFRINPENKLIPVGKTFNIKPRQSYSKEYIINGSMYLSTRKSILENNSLITSKTIAYKMSNKYSIDIDSPFDWEIAEYIMSTML